MPARRSTVRSLAMLAALVIAILGGTVWLATRQAGGTVGFDRVSSEGLLTALADTSRLTPSAAGVATHVGADGTTADTTTRAYHVPAVARVRTDLLRACAENGLSPPDADDRRLMPDILCQGRWRDHDATVHLSSRCDAACVVTLETRVI